MSIPYKTERGNFDIEITEKKSEIRDVYNDIRIAYSIKVENTDDPSWIINFSDVIGRIAKGQNKEKLNDKIVDEIKRRINMDKPGDFYIGDPTLDLT
jgi:transcription initiation factor IIE alpha subunit